MLRWEASQGKTKMEELYRCKAAPTLKISKTNHMNANSDRNKENIRQKTKNWTTIHCNDIIKIVQQTEYENVKYINQEIQNKLIKLLGNRGLRSFEAWPLHLRTRMCPVTFDPPPSWLTRGTGMLGSHLLASVRVGPGMMAPPKVRSSLFFGTPSSEGLQVRRSLKVHWNSTFRVQSHCFRLLRDQPSNVSENESQQLSFHIFLQVVPPASCLSSSKGI